MKSLTSYFFLLAGFFMIFSCKKEKSVEGGPGSAGQTQWEFKDSTLVFNGKMDTAYRFEAGSVSSVVLQGTSTDGSGDFYLEIFDNNITTSTYSSPNVQFQYIVRQVVLYESVPSNSDKFSVTITSIDADGITGTFSGEVEDALGNIKTITGTFAGKFGNSATPPPGGNGQLTIWSKQGCGGNGTIAVKVATQTGTITSFTPIAPACGAAGTATFTLPAGSYAWEAYCNLDTARGNVTIVAGNCANIEVVFGAASANCIISNLAYYDLASNAPMGSLSNFFNSSNEVNSVLFVDSNTNVAAYSFAPNRVGNRLTIDAEQYFNLDAAGRIVDFHGYVDGIEDSLPKVIITYTFNPGGYLEKAAYAFEAVPSVNILNITYTWTGGNLTKAVIQETGSIERVEYEYQYDLSKPAKNFLCFYPSTEIFWMQSAVDYGNNSNNILTTSAIRYYDSGGINISTENATYNNYIIDQDNYVKEFSITGNGSAYQGDTRYVLSYKCF